MMRPSRSCSPSGRRRFGPRRISVTSPRGSPPVRRRRGDGTVPRSRPRWWSVATSIGGIVGALTGHGLRVEVYPALSHPDTTLAGGRPPGERSLRRDRPRATVAGEDPAAGRRRLAHARRADDGLGLAIVARIEQTAPRWRSSPPGGRSRA